MLLVGTGKTAVLVADRPQAKQQKLFFFNKSSKFQYVYWLLFTCWEVRIVKNCEPGLVFSSLESQLFTRPTLNSK